MTEQEKELDAVTPEIKVSTGVFISPFASVRCDVTLPAVADEGNAEDDRVTVLETTTGVSPQLSLNL